MQYIKTLILSLITCASLFATLTANAQQPRFEDSQRIQRLCEQGYNTHRKAKDCACFVEKYKAKEMEIFKQRGTGTVPPYDAVFRLIDHECHINSAEGQAKLETCTQNPTVQGLSAEQMTAFCKCQGKVETQIQEMFKHMPQATAAQKKEMSDQMSLGAKNQCKEQATRQYR